MDVKDLMYRKRIKKDKSPISTQEEGKDLILVSYEITFDQLPDKTVRRLPPKVRKKIEQLYGMVYSDPDEAIPLLLELIEKYPQVPVLYNYLTIAYRMSGQEEKAHSMVLETYRKFPDYLFAKVNYAFYCLEKRDPYKIPEIFDYKMDLRLLYPDRKKFHLAEVMSFMGTMALYYNAIGERETGIRYYNIMSQVDPEYYLMQHLKKFLYPSFLVRLLRKIFKKPLLRAQVPRE